MYTNLSVLEAKVVAGVDEPLSVAESFQRLNEKYSDLYLSVRGERPKAWVEDDWLSPCLEDGCAAGEQCSWHLVPREQENEFEKLESVMSTTLHPSAQEYWNSFFGSGITIDSQIGVVELLQPWNEEDFRLFLQNLAGHLLTQQKFSLSSSVFIGVAVNSEHVISVDEIGRVIVELPGRKPSDVLAPDLITFLSEAEPVILPD